MIKYTALIRRSLRSARYDALADTPVALLHGLRLAAALDLPLSALTRRMEAQQDAAV